MVAFAPEHRFLDPMRCGSVGLSRISCGFAIAQGHAAQNSGVPLSYGAASRQPRFPDRAGRVQSPEVARIACDDVVAAQPGENHDRGVDNVGGFGGAAEFSARAGESVIERDNLDFVDPQKPRQCDLNAAIPPSLPHHARRHS